MKKSIVFALFVLGVSMNIMADPTPAPTPAPINETTVSNNKTLCGNVLDMLSNETLAGATISANGQKVYSDLDGNFKLDNMCSGICTLKISLISYEELTIQVDLRSTSTVKIKLEQL